MTGSSARNAWDPWAYREKGGISETAAEVVGFDMQATDGGIGKTDEASSEVGYSYVVVDTGPWIFASKVLLPAGTINGVDRHARKVYVDRSRDEIKSAPRFDQTTHTDRSYRDRLGEYYRRLRHSQ
jgi:hypothetical protein